MLSTFFAFGVVITAVLIQHVRPGSCQSCYFKNLTKSPDTIESHSGAGSTNYSNNMRCYWQISAPTGYRINLWFVYLEVEQVNDTVVIFDGVNNSAVLTVVNYTAPMMPSYTSTSNVLTILFNTSASVTMRGFRLMYQFTNSPARSDCGGVSMPTSPGSLGMLRSHAEYGIAPYPSQANCSWNLPSQTGKDIVVSVILSLAAGDCLRLSSRSLSGTVVKFYCGWVAYNNVTLRSDASVLVEFFTDAFFESRGFTLNFVYNDSMPAPANTSDSSPFGLIACYFAPVKAPRVLLTIVIVAPLILIALAITIGCLIRKRRQNRLKRLASNPPCYNGLQKMDPVYQLDVKTVPLDYPPPYTRCENM